MNNQHLLHVWRGKFDIEIRDKKGAKNLAVDLLSRLENLDFKKLTRAKIRDLFPKEQLMTISNKSDEPCGPSGGHHGITTIARKVWPNIFCNARKLVESCDACQRAGNISARDEMPQKYIQIDELDELRLDAYESSISYKERSKRWYDKWIKAPTKYEKGDKVLLFNYRLQLFLGKLKSRWYGPFTVSKDMKSRAIELYDEERNEFIVNKKCVKPYQKDVLDFDVDDDVTLEDEG
ncbi:hypothetical protein Tco_0291260 [Tanacetum coccineum]